MAASNRREWAITASRFLTRCADRRNQKIAVGQHERTNARLGPLESGAWDKKLTPAQERHVAGVAPQAFVAQVEREVDLVLIADHMVESLVVLRSQRQRPSQRPRHA
jgi:hypothetical protein